VDGGSAASGTAGGDAEAKDPKETFRDCQIGADNMKMQTKFLRLRTPVELGSRFGDWSVCWLGGWGKHRLYYLVMLVKIEG
jgi:hypothetical protein